MPEGTSFAMDESTSRNRGAPPFFFLIAADTLVLWAVTIYAATRGIDRPPGPGQGYILEAFLGTDHVASESWMWVARVGFVLSATTWSVYMLWWSKRQNREGSGSSRRLHP